MTMLIFCWQVGLPLRAATVYWDLNGTALGASSTGSAAGTWDGSNTFFNTASTGAAGGSLAAWTASDTLTIAAGTNATQAYTITVSGTQVIGGLNFEEGAVTLVGAGTLELFANSNFDVASGLTATVNTIVDDGAGTFDLTKTGAGRLVLGGTNTYDGRTIINAGTLSISADLNLGDVPALTADSITFSGSSTLQTTASFTLNSNRGITINGGVTGTLQVDPTFTLTYGGVITGAAGTTFRKTGAGTLDLSGINTLAGALNIDGGALTLSGANGALASTSGVTIGNRATFTLNNTAAANGNRTAGAIASSGGTINFIGNAGATTETLGALTLNAGALTINSTAGAGGSTLTIPSIATRAAGGTLYLNNNAGASVVLSTAPALVNSVLRYAVANNGTLISFANYPTSAGTNQTVVPLALASHNQGAETTWAAANNVRPTADVTVTAGRSLYTLTLDNGIDLLAPTADRTLTITGGVLQTGGTSIIGATATAEHILAWGANEAIFHTIGDLTIQRGDSTGVLTGSVGLTKSGPGVLQVNFANAITGVFNINEGTYRAIGAGSGTTPVASTALGNGSVAMNGGNIDLRADVQNNFGRNVTVNADGIISTGRNTAGTAAVHQLAALTMAPNRTLTLSSGALNTIDTAYGLAFTGASTLQGPATFNVNNNGTGLGTLTIGTLSGAFPITKTGAGELLTSGLTGYTSSVDIQAGAVGWGFNNSANTLTEAQLFSGPGAVINRANGTVNITGANTFTGGFTNTAGTLQFSTVSNNGGSASNLGQGTDGITLSGGTFSFIGSTSQSTNRAISITGGATLAANGTGGASITYAGAISAAANSPTFTGTGTGFLTGGFTQTGIAADVTMNGGNWTFSGAPSTIADDFTVTGATTVLNLNSTNALAFAASVDATLQIQAGAVLNLGADNAVTAAGFDRLLIGQAGAAATSTMNMGTFDLTTDRLDIGVATTGLFGVVTGTASSDLTVTTSLNLFRGSIGASLISPVAVIKQGLGDLTLSGFANNLSSATAARVDAGNLILDFTTFNTSKLTATTGLDMRGGTLTLNGNTSADSAQTVASFTLANGGNNRIDVNSGGSQAAVLNLNVITRAALANDGTMRFHLPTGTQSATNGITTDSLNTIGTGANAILGGWATVDTGSGVFFARNSTNTADGNIGAATTTITPALGSWTAGINVSDDNAGPTGFSGTLADCLIINSLRFDANAASAVTLPTGGILSIASGGILMTSNAATGAHTISGGTLNSGIGELIFIQDSVAQGLTVSSTITGTTGVTKTGNGVLTLSGDNNYSGITDIQAGTLIANGTGIGNTSAVTLADDQASTLQLTGNETIGSLAGGNATGGLTVGTVALGSNTLTINQTATGVTYAGVFTGSGAIVRNGTSGVGNTLFTGASGSGFTGTVTVNGGLLYLEGAATMDASAITVNKGASFLISNNGATRSGTRILDTTPITLNSADGAWNGETKVSGLAIRTDQNATTNETIGNLVFNSGANYLRGDASGTTGIASILANDFVRNNNATVNARGRALGGTTGDRNQFRIGTAGNQTAFIGTVDNANLVGGGGAAGTKTIDIVPWAIGETTTTTLADTNMGNSLVTYVTAAGFRALDFATEYNTFATKAANTDNIRESLTADLTGLAGTTLNALVLNNASAAANTINVTGTGAGQTLQVTSGALLFTRDTAGAGAYGITLGGFNTGITMGGAGITDEYVIYVVNPDAASATKTLTATISSNLTSTADITKSGRGILILSGANTAGGNTKKTTLNEGTLQISDLDSIGGGTGGLVFAGGTLQLGSAFDVTTDDLSTRTISFLIGGGTLDTNSKNPTFANSLGSGSGTFTKTGAGNLTLNATTAHTGATTITAGTVTLGANQAIGTGALTVSGATTVLAMGGNNATVAGLTMTSAGVSITGNGTLTVNGDAIINNTSSIAPVLAGTMNLINSGGGALSLTNAANSYTGYTWIPSGSVSVLNLANAGSASGLGAPVAGENAAIRLGSTTTGGTLLIAAAGTGGTTDRDFWLTGTTGGGTIDNDGTAALTLNVDIISRETGTKTLTLQGNTTGFSNVLNGIIDQCVGTVGLTKAEAGTWVLTGANTYSGGTSVSAGTLLVNNSSGSGTGTGLVTVNGGTSAQGLLGGTGTISGAVTLATNGATSFAQGATLNPGLVGSAGTLTINGALTTNNFAKFNFDLNTALTVGGGVNDLISTGTLPVIGASTQVNVNALSSLSVGLYTLINGYTGTIASPGNLTIGSVTGDTTKGIVALINNSGSLQALIGGATPTSAYWSGAVDGNWNTLNLSTAATNWRTDATSNTDTFALPGATTDVFFATTNPVAGNLPTTLGQNFTIKTLNFTADSDSAVTIAGNTLTITPGSSSTGISIDAGAAGAVTINSNVALGAAQTWTNNSTNSLLTVGGNVTGAFGLTVAGAGNVTISGSVPTGITGLTKTGAGTLYLSNANGFTGTTTISSGGVVKIDAESGLGAVANDVTFGTGGGTLQVTTGFAANSGKVFSVQAGPGTIQVDSGTLTIASAIVGTSAATANGGGLIKTGAGTLALTVSSSAYDAQGVGTGGAAGLAGFRVDAGNLLLQGTSTSVVGDITPNSMAIQLNGGALTIQTDTASIARANVYVTATPTTITVDRATSGNSITQAIGTGTGAGLTMGAGSSVLNLAGGGNITTGGTGAAVSFTGSASLLVSPTFNVTNATGGGAVTLTLGALNDNGTARTITKNGDGTLTLASAATSLVDGTAVNITGGTLNSNLAAALGTLAAVDVRDGTTLNIGATQQIGSLNNAGSTLNNGIVGIGSGFTLTVGNATNNLNSTFSGVINGAGALTKAGTGSMTLSGLSSTASSNYGGLTTLSAGTLVLNTGNAALTGGLTLGAAATTTAVALDVDGVNATFGGALTMNINSATASTITVDANKTLTINGNVQIGATTPAVANTVTKLTMSSGGAFNVTTAAAGTFTVGGSTSTTNAQDTTLDLTALASTTINTSTTGTFRVNPSGGTNLSNAKATLLLPTPVVADTVATATITAGTIAVGNASLFNSQAGQINTITLGTGLTTLNADTINVGTGSRDIGQIIFGQAGGDLIIRAAAGGGNRATALNIGTGGATTGTTEATTNNLVDFSGHDADILVTSLNVGNQARIGNLTSEFKFGAGDASLASVLDATNVNIGLRTGTATTTSILTNRVNLSGGTVIFGNVGGTGTGVDIGNSSYSGAGAASTIGELNIGGGTVTIYNSTVLGAAVRLGTNAATGGGTVSSSLNLTGGTTTLGGHIIRNATSPRTTSTVLLNGATATLDMGGFNIGTATENIAFDLRQGTLNNLGQFNGGANLVKTTNGTLTIGGTNSYTGNNVFQEGTVIAVGGANNRLSQAGLTLGDGTTSAVLQLGNGSGASNQTFTSLATSGTGTANAIVGGNAAFSTLTINQSTNTQFEGNIGGTGTNQNNLNVIKSGVGELSISGAASAGAAWTGTTTVNGGKLFIDHKDAFAATSTSLTVADGAEFAVRGSGLTANQVYGFGASTGNKITLGSGSGTAILGFRLDGAFNTQLQLLAGQTMTVATGTTFQTAVYVGNAPTAGQGYVLIDGADANSLHAGGGTFDFNPVVFNGGSFTYALSNVTLGGTVDRWVIKPTAQAAAAEVWWKGDLTGIGTGVWSASTTSGTGFPTNWDDSQSGGIDALVPPDSGSIVNFSATGATNFATTLGANLTIQELIFHSGGTAISVDGNSGLYTLTLGNTVDSSGITLLTGAPNVSISADVALAQAQSFNIADTASTLTFSRGLSGIGALGINSNGTSTGTMILSGVNGLATYTGATNLVAGRLILEGGANNRLPTTTALTMGNTTLGATLQLGDAVNGASNTTIGSLNSGAATTNSIVGGGGTASTLTIVQGSTGTFNGVIGGGGSNENNVALVKQGTAQLTLNGANTYTGATTVNNGILKLGASGSISGSASLSLNANAGLTATYDNNGRTTVLAGGITLGGADSSATPVIANTGGGGSITLGGNVVYDATNNPLGGSIAAPLDLGSAARTLTANNSTTAATDLTISGAVTTATPGTNGFSLTLDGAGTGTLSGPVTLSNGSTDGGSADVIKAGTGTWNLEGTFTLGDDFVINAGVLNVNTGGSIFFNATPGTTTPDFFTDVGTSSIANFNAVNSIVGNSATNRLFSRDGSTINLNISGAIGSSIEQVVLGGEDNQGVGNMVLAGGTTNTLNSGTLILGFNSAGENGNLTGTGTLAGVTTMTLRNGTVSANVTGTGNATKTETFTVTLSGDNSLTGTTAVNIGTLALDYSTNAGTNNKIGTGNFSIGSATHSDLRPIMSVTGHATTASRQNVANFTVLGGPSQINLTGTSGVDNILRITGDFIRTGGTAHFSLANANTKLEYSGTGANTNGMLPAWMTLNRSDFLAISENGAVDNLVAATYTTQNNAVLWESNQNITNSAGFSGTVDAACNTINSLRFNAAAASTVTVGAGNSLIVSSGGLMATAAVGNNASVITGGNLVSGVGEFFFHQNNTANTLSIASRILFSPAITKTGVGTLVLSGTNNQTGAVTIEEGILRLSGGSALSDTSAVTIRNSGGTANTGIELAASQTETIGTLTANTTAAAIILNTGSTLTINQGSAQTMAGVISGAGTFVKGGSATLTLTGTSTMTGTVRVDEGQLLLSGNVANLGTATAIILNGPTSSIQSNQDQAAATNRLNGTVLLNNTAGGTGLATSYSALTAAGNDSVGALTLGAGHNVITSTSSTAFAGSTTFASLAARNNRATVLVRGAALGDSATATRGQIIFTAAPTGANVAVGGGGAAGSQNISIFPWMIGSTSATGLGNSFVMNTGTTNGLRPLTTAEYTTDAAGFNGLTAATLSTNNLRFATGATLTGTATGVNSLVIDAATGQTVTGPANTFEITSGAILAASSGTTITHALGGFTAITTGGGRDYTTYVTSATGTLTINSPLNSAVPLVKSGAGTLILASGSNVHTDVFMNQGYVQVDANSKLGTGTLNFFGGGIRLGTGYADDLSSKTWTIGTGGGLLNTNSINTTFANGIKDSTASTADFFTKQGVGALTVQGASTFTGTFIVEQTNSGTATSTVAQVVLNGTTNQAVNGNLQIGANTVPSSNGTAVVQLGASDQIADTAVISFSGGASNKWPYFQLLGFNETVAGISDTTTFGVLENRESQTVSSSGTLTLNSSADFSYNGIFRDVSSGAADANKLILVKQGTGTQTLSGAQIRHSGTTTISGGALTLTDVTNWQSAITNNATLNLNQTTGSRTHAQAISGTGTLVKLGAGTVVLSSATSSYSGLTDIQQGILSASTSNNLGDASATNDIRIANGATLQATGTFSLGVNRDISLSGVGGIIEVTGSNVLTTPGVISGDDCQTLTKTGTGTLVLTGVNTYGGSTIISAGTLSLGDGGTTGSLDPLSTIINNGTLTFNRSNTLDQGTDFAAVISGTGAVTQAGAGTTILDGTNTYTGVTTVSAGTLRFAKQTALYNNTPASWTAANLVVNSGTTAAFNVGGSGEFTAANVTTLLTNLSNVSNDGLKDGSNIGFDTTNSTGGTFTIADTIADSSGTGGGAVGVTKLGTGVLILGGNNTYTGGTTITDGTLQVGSGSTTGTLGSGTITNNATLTFNRSDNYTVNANITTSTSSGKVIQAGNGSTILGGNNSYQGGTDINAGTLQVDHASALGSTGAVDFGGGTLRYGSGITTDYSARIANSASAIKIDTNGETVTFATSLANTNTGGLEKSGSGTLVLSASSGNAYTGSTILSGGTLEVNNTAGSATGSGSVTVNAGTLAGSGIIAGSTILGSGTILAPGEGNTGNSNKTLTFTAATTSITAANDAQIQLGVTTADSVDGSFATWFHANPGGTAAGYLLTLTNGIADTNWNSTPAGGHDFITASGTIVLGSSATTDKRIAVSLNSSTGLTYGSIFNLLDWSTLGAKDGTSLSAMSGTANFNISDNLLLEALSGGLAWDTSVFNSYGILVVVPEPSRALFLMLGLLGLLMRRRRR